MSTYRPAMTGTTLPANEPIDLMPPMMTANTRIDSRMPTPQLGMLTPRCEPVSNAASVMELAWIIDPVAMAENSVPRQKMMASQPQPLPSPFLI